MEAGESTERQRSPKSFNVENGPPCGHGVEASSFGQWSGVNDIKSNLVDEVGHDALGRRTVPGDREGTTVRRPGRGGLLDNLSGKDRVERLDGLRGGQVRGQHLARGSC